MRKSIRPLCFQLLLILLTVSATLRAAPTTAPAPVEPIVFERQTLPNGLDVIYAPLHNAPVVHVRVLYHVGSRDEKPDHQGFAHMFEHMMFRGSAHVPPEQHMKLIGIVGGESNAFTSYDQTTYYETIPSNATEMALYLEADRMASFKVNDSIFQTERKVVAEEWRMRYANQPLGPLGQDFARTAFTTHSYRWTPIGDMDQLRRATSADLQKFFNTYYVPNNACLVIAGDIDVPQTKQWVNKYFGWIPKGAPVPRDIPKEPEQTAARRLVVEKPNVPETVLYMGFKTPGYRSDDHYALSMLGDILSSGQTGRLDRALVNGDDPTCLDVGAGDDQLEDPSTFVLEATVQQGKDPDAVQKQILDIVYNTAAQGVTQDELDKVRTQARQSIIRSRQTCAQIASSLGEEEVFGGDANRVNELLPKLDALTPADIQAVAKKYFVPDHLTVVQYRPEANGTIAKQAAATQVAEASARAQQTETAAVVPSTEPVLPRVTAFPPGYPDKPPFNDKPIKVTFNKGIEQTVDGLRVITLTDKRLPLVNLSLIMPGGSDGETLDKVGLGGMTAQMLQRGSAGIPFLQFSNDLESRGISISPADASDTTRLLISCTTDQLDYAVKRANQMLTQPMFPQEEFDKFKRQSIGGLIQALSNPSAVVGRELTQALYPNSILGRVTKRETLEAITLDDVKNWYKQYYQLDGAFLVVSGDVTPEKAAEVAKNLLAGFDRKNRPKPVDYSVKPLPQGSRIILVDNPDGRQATIRMAIRAYDVHSPDKFPGSVSGTILSAGIESRLNRYVRAEKGLTYGCAAYFSPSRHAGSFNGSVDTNPQTAFDAIQAMLKVFNDMRTEDVTPTELLEAKSRVAGGMVMEMQTISQQASRRVDQILNGYPIDYWDVYPQQIAQVPADRIRDVMDKYVKPDGMIYVVVAPASIVKTQLEKLGTVEVVPMPLKRQPATAASAMGAPVTD